MKLIRQLEAVTGWFSENFTQRGELGASLSIWHEGREVLSLAEGSCDREGEIPWGAETPVLVWSATKGPAAATLLHALLAQGESLATPVRAIWPEFAQHGKGEVSVADLLGHRAGLAAMEESLSALDHAAVAEALAAQAPNWMPGEEHGYHPRTFGYLLDELVRRLEGVTLGEYWERWFATPLGLDFWIGLPEKEWERPSPIYAARVTPGKPPREEDLRFYEAMADPASLTARAFASPRGAQGVSAMNSREYRMASLPGFGGIGTARALGRFYALLAEGGALDGLRLFERQLWQEEKPRSGEDRVLQRATSFAAGFMRDPLGAGGEKVRQLFGPSLHAFGQPGAGGAHAFADPENRIAFAYVMNQMEPGVLPNEKALGLVRHLYA